jgi:dolichol-phosphate mannosyltransferase
MAGSRMRLSVVIPAKDEAANIEEVVVGVIEALDRHKIDHEVIVVDDGSTDETAAVVDRLAAAKPHVRCVGSPYPGGFGYAVRVGLDEFQGDAVAVMMADGSDSPEDLAGYHYLLENYDCAFGSRFMHGSRVEGYPPFKLVINRIVNEGIRILFRHGYNDTTNAFKAYRREVVEHIQPLLSNHFNLTVEMPLKAIVRGFNYGIVPISWTNKRTSESNLSLQEMGSRYLFIVLYVFLEHHLSRGDYRHGERAAPRAFGWARGDRDGRRRLPSLTPRSREPR